MKNKLILLFIGGIILFYVLDSLMIISFAESYNQNTQKKTYEELEKEVQMYKNLHAIAGFRTIDIIFGWNNVFSGVGHFCDNVINVLDSYYLWTPLKWTTIIGLSIFLGMIIMGVVFRTELNVVDLTNLPDVVFIKDKNEFIDNIMEQAKFEKVQVNDKFDIMNKFSDERGIFFKRVK